MKKINDYKILVFDCDGVILNSNKIKTDAFAETVRFISEEAADVFRTYHLKNGGISRYHKFDYFEKTIMPELGIKEKVDIETLLKTYADKVKMNLMSCEVDESLLRFKEITTKCSSWAVASGSDQSELRYIFKERNLEELFELGIWGSPRPKQEIFSTEFTINDPKEILFIGDSLYDYKVSVEFGCDFVFLSHWSEFREMNIYSRQNNIPRYSSLSELFNIV